MMILALIPARSGSKRVPGKNTADLAGKPLLWWSIQTALQIKSISYVIVSTDSPEIGALTESYGATYFPRTLQNARDESTDFDVIVEVCQNFDADQIVYLRPSTPFRTTNRVEEAVKKLTRAESFANSLRSVERMAESAWKSFEISGPWLRPIASSMETANLPDQQVVPTYRGNGYVDIVKPDYLMGHGELWGRCIAYVTPAVIEIDTPEQLDYARWWIEQRGRRFDYMQHRAAFEFYDKFG